MDCLQHKLTAAAEVNVPVPTMDTSHTVFVTTIRANGQHPGEPRGAARTRILERAKRMITICSS